MWTLGNAYYSEIVKKIIIVTGSRLPHRFFRKALALSSGLQVLRSYLEVAPAGDAPTAEEEDFLGALASFAPDISEPKSAAPDAMAFEEELKKLKPDLIVVFGSAEPSGPLPANILDAYKKKVITLELGDDRAFFREPQGAGKPPKPLHELKARIRDGESAGSASVRARLLVDAAKECAEVVRKLEEYREKIAKH